jgi:predicted DsbA family dithiol-disulfide isomerase
MSDPGPAEPQPPVAPGVIRVHSDIACPWSHLFIHRLRRHQEQLGLEGDLRIEHRAVPLELINGRAGPIRWVEAEVEALREVEPDAGWATFTGEASEYPVTSLPALVAVQAAQDPAVGRAEALDAALRRAYFAEWRCLSLYPVVLDVAAEVGGVDVSALEVAIRSGHPQAEVWRQLDEFRELGLQGSPQVLLSDGTSIHNPGISFHWDGGEPGRGRVVVDEDDPAAVARLVEQALESMHFD